MGFDFATQYDRHDRDALALDSVGKPFPDTPEGPDEGFDVIPMWVADMSFATAPSVVQAIQRRVDHPLFGYFYPSGEAIDSIVRWQCSRNGLDCLAPEHISFHNGLLGGVLSALSAVASPGDCILLNSPTYTGFTNTLRNAGYRIILSPLILDSRGVYRMDYRDMDRKIAEFDIRAAILCSPHNPTGRVWTVDELTRAMAVFESHGCLVVSDEIWSDIILEGNIHIPTQSVSDYARNHVVGMYAPSKTFNIAGLPGAYSLIYDQGLKRRIDSLASKSHYNEMNVLSMHAMIGGYSEQGALWLDALRLVIDANVQTCIEFFSTIPGVFCSRPQGTYMLFLDFTGWCASCGCTLDDLLRDGWRVGVAWQDGRPFHGECHIRMNLALPAARLDEALARLRTYVFHDQGRRSCQSE